MAPRKKQVEQEVEQQEELEVEAVQIEAVEEDVDSFEEVAGDDEIVPGGPTNDQVEDWKSRFQDKVFMTEIESKFYVWRPIRRTEYKNIMKIQNADRYYTEEQICTKCILFPENFRATGMANGLAGVPSVLAELILEKSGFNPTIQAVQL